MFFSIFEDDVDVWRLYNVVSVVVFSLVGRNNTNIEKCLKP